MTPEQIATLVPALSGFHQDFDLDDINERDVLVWHARGLDASAREPFYLALEALLRETKTEREFVEACWNAGAHIAPRRAELEGFVTWARTPDGAAEIAGPGPISMYSVVRAKIGPF
jgi:hypothetical protein